MTLENTIKLSSEQECAVDVSRNIAVSAGAGSGKTTVLIARFLNLLQSGLSVEQIGAITFTEKAALEMKRRIRKVINEKIASSPPQDKDIWMSHLDNLGRANISTIHSFCAGIVRENAASLGIDFKFSIISEIDETIALNESLLAATNHYLSSSKYYAAADRIINTFGEGYINVLFPREIMRLRSDMHDKALNIQEMYNKMEDKSPEKLCIEIVGEVDRLYMDYKISHDVLDYSDLENLAYSILKDKRLRERYRNRFKSLLVDEFQDTNAIQKRIIYAIAADDQGVVLPKKLFVVGDFKQSIYGFRGTDYTIFKNVAEDIGNEGKVSLNTCYRSKNEIIYEINSIFSTLIENYEDLTYPNGEGLNEKRINLITYEKLEKPPVNIITEVKKLLHGKHSSEFKDLEEAFASLRKNLDTLQVPENKEGIAVARAVRFLLDKGLELRDICVLVRSRYVVPEIEEELKERRLPHCIIGGRGFYKKDEVQEVINLYKVLVRGFKGEFSPSDNRNFIKALRGILFQIPDSLILKVKVKKDESGLSNLFKAAAHVIETMDDGDDKLKLIKAHNILDKLSKLKERLSVVEIFRTLVEECSVYTVLLSREDGIQMVRNIEKLLYEIEKADAENLFTHGEFIFYIDMLYDTDAEDSEASLDTEDSDAVKIMTIHQAKGLEFKGVIIPKIHGDLLSMSRRDRPNVVLHQGKIIFSKDLDTGEENEEYNDYYNSRLSKEVDENIRLLYVAMTRAKDYIVLTGENDRKDVEEVHTSEDKIKNLNSFFKMIRYAVDVKGASREFVGFY